MSPARILIRDEVPGDYERIYEIVEAAFKGRPYAGGDEQDLVNVLREQGGLTISLVAMDGDELVGHIAFSPATTADGSEGWFTLGPVAVTPARQSESIGGQLINAGLDLLIARDAAGCILTGNPIYYERFGFEFAPDNVPPGESAEYFMVKLLSGQLPEGPFDFHPAFHP